MRTQNRRWCVRHVCVSMAGVWTNVTRFRFQWLLPRRRYVWTEADRYAARCGCIDQNLTMWFLKHWFLNVPLLRSRASFRSTKTNQHLQFMKKKITPPLPLYHFIFNKEYLFCKTQPSILLLPASPLQAVMFTQCVGEGQGVHQPPTLILCVNVKRGSHFHKNWEIMWMESTFM